uniref:Group II intron reverse transcriptase/maturase n=1 Tax=Taenia asiatica TaxID=60517 RepID=A0A0R3W151_TAEAS
LRSFLIWIRERTKRNRMLKWLSPFRRQKKMRRVRLGIFTGD